MTEKDYRKLEFVKGDVFWANLPKYNQSSVQSGTRPVVIVSSLKGNLSSDVVMIAPLTTRIKNLCVNADIEFKIDDRQSQVLCNQIQTVPKSALFNYAGHMSWQDIEKVDEAILISLGISKAFTDSTISKAEALATQKEDRKALDDLIPRATEIIKQLTEIINRQTIKKIPKNLLLTKKKAYTRRTPEEIADFIREWEDPYNDRNDVASAYGFSGYGAAYNLYWNHKKKMKEASNEK